MKIIGTYTNIMAHSRFCFLSNTAICVKITTNKPPTIHTQHQLTNPTIPPTTTNQTHRKAVIYNNIKPNGYTYSHKPLTGICH